MLVLVESLHYLENDSAIFNIMFLIITGNLQFNSAWQDNEHPGSYKLGPIQTKEQDYYQSSKENWLKWSIK